MDIRSVDCFVTGRRKAGIRVVHGVRSADQKVLSAMIGPLGARFAVEAGFAARPGEIRLVPGENGETMALFGLPAAGRHDPLMFGALARSLPGGIWSASMPQDVPPGDVLLGFCLGAYRFSLKSGKVDAGPKLFVAKADLLAVEMVQSIWLGRDLINMPANLLGPQELARAARSALDGFGAETVFVKDSALKKNYPLVFHVGAGSARPPRVVISRWQGSKAGPDAPLLSMVGKGVCFDTGGNDIKPSSGMLRMKKDMGGAATMLALARLIMARDLPLRLELRLACVENSVSGTAMRPLDVVRSRSGVTVEIGNTDAEGRLVMADLLTEACEGRPDLLIDAATLTGAARVAVGPDLPVLMSNDDGVAESLLAASIRVKDPLWRLPLWDGYRDWLHSSVADINNVASKPMAGAITAGLFLERFVATGVRWAHIDTYGWNDSNRPGRPEGAEIMGIRAVFEAIFPIFNLSPKLNSCE